MNETCSGDRRGLSIEFHFHVNQASDVTAKMPWFLANLLLTQHQVLNEASIRLQQNLETCQQRFSYFCFLQFKGNCQSLAVPAFDQHACCSVFCD